MTDESSAGAGPWGEEAQRLVVAIQEWAQRALPAPPSGHPGPECQWCPLCQLASVLRGEHPELTERFAEAATAVAGALQAVVDSAARHVPPQRPDAAPQRPSPAPHVERIRLDDEPDHEPGSDPGPAG